MPGNTPAPGASAAQRYGTGNASGEVSLGGRSATSLGDILERVLDKGLVIAGDIQVNLLDIELLTIKLRLVIASLDTARQVGINWWENDPWLSADAGRRAAPEESGRGEIDDGGGNRELRQEIRRLRGRISELESGDER
jgi:gas vesicle protein GvpA/GvpJ/GvpM family